MYRFSFCQFARQVSAICVSEIRSDSAFAERAWSSCRFAALSIAASWAAINAAVYFALKFVNSVNCSKHESQPRRAAE